MKCLLNLDSTENPRAFEKYSNPPVGLGISGKNRFSVEFILVETKQVVGINVNVVLTQQTCGRRSSMSAGSKR